MDDYQAEIQQANETTTRVTSDTFKEGLQQTINQINKGFQWTMYMYLSVFIVGIALLSISTYIALTTDKEIASAVFGGMGMASILSFFFSKTPLELQRSRGELAQLQAALFNWFIDLTNWNSFLLHHKNINFDELKKASDEQMKRTEQTVQLISEHVRKINT